MTLTDNIKSIVTDIISRSFHGQQQPHDNEFGTSYSRSLAEDVNASFAFTNPIKFQVPPVTESFAQNSFRFGYTRDFSMLFGTTDERTDYICGIAWLGIILAALFALWILVILIFCALGSKRVGFLSGKRFQRTYYYVNSSGKNVNMSGDMDDAEEPIYKNGGNSFMKPTMSSGNRSSDDDDDVYIENDTNKPNGQAYHSTPPNHGRTIPTNHETAVVGGGVKCCCWDQAVWIRGIFILSAVIFIIFSILLVTEGLTNLQGTIDSVSKSSYDIRETSTKTQGIVDVVLGIQANSTGLRQTLETELKDENLCPANPDLSQGQPTQTIKSLATSALEWLNQLNAYSESSDLKSLSASLESSSNAADNVYFQTKDVDISDWESLMILIPHTIIPCLLAAKAIMAAFDTPSQIFHCITAWVLVPLFVLMVISSAIISSAIVMVASSNSDFCYPEQYTVNPTSLVPNARQYNSIINSPDISVLQIIKNQGYDVNSTEYKGISFYILQCLQENPFGDVEKYVPTLESSQAAIDKLATELDAADIATELTALCGRDFAPLVDSLQQLKDTLITLATTAVEAVKLLSCDNIVPIYQTTFYDGTCKYSIRAVMWVFSASLIMSFFGFLMITFRSALYETNYTYTYDTGHGRNSAFHDENDDDMVGDDGQTRAGATTYAPDSVMQSFEKYENNHLHNNNTIEKY